MASKAKVPRPKKGITQQKITIEGPNRRYVMADIGLTRAHARAKTTRLLKGGYSPDIDTSEIAMKEGQSLKNGILGMAETANIPAEDYYKLSRMDPAKLRDMYDQNKLIYDAYFSYEGVNYKGGAWVPNAGAKQQDTAFLIEQYERLYGRLA